jgi:hypothetical protein
MSSSDSSDSSGDDLPKTTKLDKDIFSKRKALSNTDLQAFCSKHGLAYNLVDLDKLATLSHRYAFVFTGFEPNNINKGHDKHWLFVDGNLIFDSYGGKRDYQYPEEFHMVKNHPNQLQEFNSTVCGEYCCAFYWFTTQNPEVPENELGIRFGEHFGFTSSRRKNDRIVYKWYHSKNTKEET